MVPMQGGLVATGLQSIVGNLKETRDLRFRLPLHLGTPFPSLQTTGTHTGRTGLLRPSRGHVYLHNKTRLHSV